MRKALQVFGFLIFFGSLSTTNAQIHDNVSTDSSGENHEARMKDYQEARLDILIKNLGLSDSSKQEEFRNIYKDYEVSQMFVMRDFREKFYKKDLSEEKTKEKIYIGFDVSQKLLNNKKTYADRFLKILTPKQLEKMFEIEKRFGRRLMDRKREEEEKK